MDTKMLGNVMMIALSGMGVIIDKVDDQFDKCTFWVSVPETSNHVDAHGNEMAGAMLAKRIKTTMTEMTGGAKPIDVRYKIRAGDNWDDTKKEAAEKSIKGSLYNGWVK